MGCFCTFDKHKAFICDIKTFYADNVFTSQIKMAELNLQSNEKIRKEQNILEMNGKSMKI